VWWGGASRRRCPRSTLDALQMVEELQHRRVSLHLLDLGGDVSGNGMAKLFLTIAAAFAEAERARIRERVSQTKRDQRQRGRYLGGKVPFGFRVGEDGGLVEDEAEQAVIRRAGELRAAGAPLRALSTWWATRGAPSRGSTALSVTPPLGRTSPVATPERLRCGRADIEQQSSGAGADGSGRRSWRAMIGTAGPARAT
jgi:DNA invertase Pin-like site-specific DNA recombinase